MARTCSFSASVFVGSCLFRTYSSDQEVQKQLGEHAALRCSIWNGYDLTTSDGVARLKKLISQIKPVHIWISCGPYSSRTQSSFGQETSVCLFRVSGRHRSGQAACDRKGSQIYWELSERCEAWNLPFIQQFLQNMKISKTTCSGCNVNLRTQDTNQLLCKGWNIAPRNQQLLRHLHLPCQQNQKKTPCEAGRAAATAVYTPVFAKKVVEALLRQEPWSLVAQELQEDTSPDQPEEETLAATDDGSVVVPFLRQRRPEF